MAITKTQEYFAHLMKHGISRTNRFQVLIPLPRGLNNKVGNLNQSKTSSIFNHDVISLINSFVGGGGGTEVTRGLELMAESTDIPGKVITTSDLKYNGDFYRQGFASVYSEQPFVFRVSREMYEKNVIDEWMNLIIDPNTHVVSYYDDYVTDITINQLDEQDRIVYSIILKDAFPIMCSPLSVSNEDVNQVHKLSTAFAFRKWIREGENEGHVDGDYTMMSQTVLGPILTPILSNPVVKKALEIVENATGIDLEGEAVNIYNQVENVVRASTGTSINTTISVLNDIIAQIKVNHRISNTQQAQLIEMIQAVIGTLRN